MTDPVTPKISSILDEFGDGTPSPKDKEHSSKSWHAPDSEATPPDNGKRKSAEEPWWEGLPVHGTKKQKSRNSSGGGSSAHNQGAACSDSPEEKDRWGERQPGTGQAKLTQNGKWFRFPEVDMAPGKNEATFRYRKNAWSTEDAIAQAKWVCMKKNYIGFVLVHAWGQIFYKNKKHVGSPSCKHAHTGLALETHVWLWPKQERPWHRAAEEAQKKLQNSQEMRADIVG